MRRSFRFLADLAGFSRFVIRRWFEDRCPLVAGSLTYTTLLALVPVFAVAVAVLSSAPFFAPVMAQVKVFLLANLAPEIARRIITVYMEDFSANAQRLTWAGTVAVLFLSVMLMLGIDRSINASWRVRRSRPYWLLVLGYIALLVAGPVLIGLSVTATTYVLSLSFGAVPLAGTWHPVLYRVIPGSMSALAFFLVYVIVPHRRVPWRHALVGSLVAAALFEAAKELFGVYVHYARTYSLVYGAFAALPLFLVWIYVSWLVILLGAEITASAAYWRGRLWAKAATPGMRLRESILVTRRLLEAGEAPVSFERLRADTGLPAHEVEDTLARMGDAGIVRRVGRAGYAFAKDPGVATLADLYEATVAPVSELLPEEWSEVSEDFARAASRMREGLKQPLSSLRSIAGDAPGGP
jgi:membrane protein